MNQLVTIDEQRMQVLAVEINTIQENTKNMVLANACEIGKRLIEVKNGLPHGRFREWLQNNTTCSERSAQNMMALFEEYAKNPNERALSTLSVSQAIALLAAPEEVRDELIESGEAADMSVRELQREIKRQREEIESSQLRIDELEQAVQDERAEKDKQILAAARAETAKEQARRKQGEAERQARQAAEERNEALRKMEYEQRLRGEAERALDEANAAEKVVEIEVTPPEVLRELESLREIARRAPSEGVVLARNAYKRITQEFETLFALLGEMPDSDAEKYRPAFAMGMRRMLARLEGDKK